MVQNFTNSYSNRTCSQKNNDYMNEEMYFKTSISRQEFSDESLYRMIITDLKEGKYAKARKLLEENVDNNTIQIKQAYGLLENIEYNFEASKRYYNECMIDPEMQYKSLLSLAKLNIQTEDNEIARKMFETLQFNQSFKELATIGLICLNILEQNYKDAEKLLMSIDEKRLTSKSYCNYNFLNVYVKYCLGKLKRSDNHFDPVRNYRIYRLFDNNEYTLLDHISKHMNQDDKEGNGCFFKYIDLKRLLYDVRDKIDNLNPNHFEISDVYNLKLDSPIGFKGDEITSDLRVVTIIGTKKIITMHPVLLSDKFDNEGFSTNRQLTLKRNYGVVEND